VATARQQHSKHISAATASDATTEDALVSMWPTPSSYNKDRQQQLIEPPQCLWCGGGDHLHEECPEKTNIESTPSCCNCTLVKGEKPHPASFRGCSHVKGELQRRGVQVPKGSSGRTFFSKFTSPEQSLTLCQDTQHKKPQASQTEMKSLRPPVQQHLPQQEIQRTSVSTGSQFD
jgi:hypothetical protein